MAVAGVLTPAFWATSSNVCLRVARSNTSTPT